MKVLLVVVAIAACSSTESKDVREVDFSKVVSSAAGSVPDVLPLKVKLVMFPARPATVWQAESRSQNYPPRQEQFDPARNKSSMYLTKKIQMQSGYKEFLIRERKIEIESLIFVPDTNKLHKLLFVTVILLFNIFILLILLLRKSFSKGRKTKEIYV